MINYDTKFDDCPSCGNVRPVSKETCCTSCCFFTHGPIHYQFPLTGDAYYNPEEGCWISPGKFGK